MLRCRGFTHPENTHVHLPKNIPLKAALLTLALAANHAAHAATFQDEAIAFATNNPHVAHREGVTT